MNVESYNLSEENKLTFDRFKECHMLIDNIEDFVQDFIALKTPNSSYISKDANIHPSTIIGENVFIDDNVIIGPYCYVKSNVILLDGVRLGYSVEIDRCLLFEHVKIAHNTCIGRCIIGRNSNLAYNFVIATKNLQKTDIKSYFHKELYLSTRRHHGAVIGENLITGVNVAIMPGTTIEHNVIIRNNQTVSGFIASESTI